MPNDRIIIPSTDDQISGLLSLDELPAHRTAAVILCLFYAVLLALAQGYRIGRTAGRKTRTRFSNVLVYIQGVICTAFLFVVAIIVAGLGLQTDLQCYAAIRICIAMYGSAKIALTLFLLERVHIVRAPFVKRWRDPIWVIGAIVAVCGYIGITGVQFINPESQLSRTDAICRIGIQDDASIAVMVFDTVLNFSLTATFLWQVRPALKSITPRFGHSVTLSTQKKRTWWSTQNAPAEGLVGQIPAYPSAHKNVRCMLIRNVVGSAILLANVIANNAVFIRYPFAKMGHACLLMCLTDIVVGMLITHWLTIRAAEEVDESRGATTFSPYSTSNTSAPQAMRSRRATLDYSMLRSDAFGKFVDKAAPISNAKLQIEKVDMSITNR